MKRSKGKMKNISKKAPLWKSEQGEMVRANTKSEARAVLKKLHGKLPVGFKIEKQQVS